MAKSNDFEVHDIGTTQEIKLSRELTREMSLVAQQYGAGIFPHNVLTKLNALLGFYKQQMDNERQ